MSDMTFVSIQFTLLLVASMGIPLLFLFFVVDEIARALDAARLFRRMPVTSARTDLPFRARE